MKKIIFILVASLLLFSCSPDKKENNNETKNQTRTEGSKIQDNSKTSEKEMTENGTVDNKQLFTLKYKFPKDDLKYTVKKETITNINVLYKDSTDSNNKIETLTNNILIKLVDKNKDGTYDIDVLFKDFDLNFDLNGVKKNYSSTNLPKDKKGQRNIDFHIALLDNPFTVTLNNKGKIILIAGTDKIVESLLKMYSKGQTISAVDKTSGSQKLIENILLPFTKDIFRILPEKDISKDSVWVDKFTERIGQFILGNSFSYQLVDLVGENELKFNIQLTSKIIKTIDKYVDSNIVFKKKPTLNGKGYFVLDYKKGIITQIHLDTIHEYEFQDLGAEAKPTVHYLITDILDVKKK